MKRITVDEVLAAYAKTGLKPARHLWANTDNSIDGKFCKACALGVVTIAELPGIHPFALNSNRITEALELSPSYMSGYIQGFDGDKCEDACGMEWKQGYDDGQAAAAAVFGEGATA